MDDFDQWRIEQGRKRFLDALPGVQTLNAVMYIAGFASMLAVPVSAAIAFALVVLTIIVGTLSVFKIEHESS